MCAADTTLEHARPGTSTEVDGWGASHECRDWDTVTKLAIEHAIYQPDEMGGGLNHKHTD